MILFLLIYSVWLVILILGSPLGVPKGPVSYPFISPGGGEVAAGRGASRGLVGEGVLPRFRLAAWLPRLQRGKRFFRPLAKKHIVAGPLAVSCRLPTAVRPSVVPPFPYICTANMATQSYAVLGDAPAVG